VGAQQSKGHGAVGDKAVAALGLVQADRGAIALCASWALFTFFVFMGVHLLSADFRADWFPTVVSLLKIGAFLIAALLCWRNTQKTFILSGRVVWQSVTAGMIFYALGDMTVMLWRSLWGITSVVSLGDVFYGASYLFLAIGLLNAVLPRQINLSWAQSLGIAIAGITGIVLACWINFYSPADLTVHSVVINSATSAQTAGAQTAGAQTAGAQTAGAQAKQTKSAAIGAVTNLDSSVPALVALIDQRLSRVSNTMGLLYVVGDCVLIVMAAALLVAFWGGSYSEAWKLIALAGLCLYVADMFLIYQVGQGRYEQGAAWEIFWVLSALFFGLGAGVEYGVSLKMIQKRSRKQWL
jgi:hypothetical protein